MGAPENKAFRGFIPKEQLGEASSWEFASFGSTGGPGSGGTMRPPPQQITDRERRAYEHGLAQGTAQGRDAERRVKADHGARLTEVLDELRARFGELESAGADAVLDLAFAIARQVVRHEIATQRDALLPVAREAVALVVDQHAHPRVFLNPHDLELLREDLDSDGLFKGCRFIADARVARGGCRVETPHGEVDATVHTRWQRVLAALGAQPLDLQFDAPAPAAGEAPPPAPHD